MAYWYFKILQSSIEEKIETICKEIYGADGIEILPLAQEQINRYKNQVKNYIKIIINWYLN